jgi:hypothetical protein
MREPSILQLADAFEPIGELLDRRKTALADDLGG